jgi:hypothetical protein
MSLPKHYQLKGENPKDFEIYDTTDGSTFRVAKKGIHPARQMHILRLPKYSEGGEVRPGLEIELQKLGDRYSPPPQQPVSNQLSPEAMAFVSGSQNKPMSMDWNPMDPGPQFNPMLPTPEPEVAVSPVDPRMSATEPAQQTQQSSMGGVSLPDLNSIYGQGAAGIMGAAEAEAEQQKQIADTVDPYLKAQEQQMQMFQQKMKSYQDQADQLAQGVAASEIDPNRYMNSKDTGGKIRTGIAILLGGAGQGLMGTQSNAVMDYINKQIDRDIDAQKANLGKKQSLLSNNLQIQGSLVQAENATRLQMASIVQGQISKIAAQTNSPILMSKAQAAIAEWRAKLAPVQVDLAEASAKRQMMNNAMKSGDVSAAIIGGIPKEHQGKAFEELGAFRAIQTGINEVDNTIEDMFKVNSVGNRVLNPIQSKAQIDTAEARLMPIVKKIIDERMTDADARTMIRPYVTGILENEGTKDKKKAELLRALRSKVPEKTPILSSFGVDLKLQPYKKFSEGPVK